MNAEVTYAPLLSELSFKARLEDSVLHVVSNKDHTLKAKFQGNLLSDIECNAEVEQNLLLDIAMEHLFGLNRSLLSINEIPRSEFFQRPHLWTLKRNHTVNVERWTETKGVAHPERGRLPEGIFYRKYVPQIGKALTLRLLTEADLDTFHSWHNRPRVNHFWELAKPKEELREYIQNGLKDPHQFPIMVQLDGVPVGYYEFYWVKEDRLGPYYESEAFDRGFHFLIGNTDFLGFKTTDSLIKTVLHFLFLDDPRTRKIMAEPRHDNQKVLKYAESAIGWKKLKEFDFPHKRAALLECRRELFFGGSAL
jgi:acetyl CoA:N6-hydroxylysine acetyl transferase